MRPDKPMTNDGFEYELQWAIDNGATEDCGLPNQIIELFSRIHKAGEAGREPLLALVRERWEDLKRDYPDRYTD